MESSSSNYGGMTLSGLYACARSERKRPYYIEDGDKYVQGSAETALEYQTKAKTSLEECVSDLNDLISSCEASLTVNDHNPLRAHLEQLSSAMSQTVDSIADSGLKLYRIDQEIFPSFDRNVAADLGAWYNNYLVAFNRDAKRMLTDRGYKNFEWDSSNIICRARQYDNETGALLNTVEQSAIARWLGSVQGLPGGYPIPNRNIAYHNGIYGVDYCICDLSGLKTSASSSVKTDNRWTTYEEAAAHFPGIMTKSEFTRRKPKPGRDDGLHPLSRFDTYQDYLDYYYDKYTNNSSVTVQSGQEVSINGETCYFVMRDYAGRSYFTKTYDDNAIVYYLDENGTLQQYANYGSDNPVSRKNFVSGRKQNLDVQWSVEYNNGSEPFDRIGDYVDVSFTDGVAKYSIDNKYVSFDKDYLQANATSMDKLMRSDPVYPSVIYVGPGEQIKYDKPWSFDDNVIDGGSEGCYLVYNADNQRYYKVDENGGYKTKNVYVGLSIAASELYTDTTSFIKKGR